ncbi:MAG: hypothetical protein MUE88_07840, partial [Flavobacteriales bacterium]|nr:hypothetical protein [Flavobacteriales bacterium]
MLRTIALLLFIFLISGSAAAQIQVGPPTPIVPFLTGKWKEHHLPELKKSTTLLFVPGYSDEDVEYLQRELMAFWDLSTLRVCNTDELERCVEGTEGETRSFFRLSFQKVVMQNTRNEDPHSVYYYLELVLPKGRDKNGKAVEQLYARIALDPTLELYKHGIDLPENGNPWASFDPYTSLTNLQPAMLLNYIKYIHSVIKSGEERNMYTEENEREELSKLKDKKLYVLDNVLHKMNLAKRTSTPIEDPKELFDDYPYRYEFISSADLNSKLMEGDEQF